MFLLFWKKNEFVSIWHESLLHNQCRKQSADLVKSIYVNKKCNENIPRLKQDAVWSQTNYNTKLKSCFRSKKV